MAISIDPPQAARAPSAPLARSAKLGWAVGDFGFNIYWQSLNLLMMPFYTDVLGLSPALAGLVFLLASFWDGFADAVIGAIADRTRTRYGSYRPYLIFASPLLAVCFMASFLTPQGEQGGLFLYALLSQILLRTAYSVVQIPYSSLAARISADSNERTEMAGWRIAFAMLGGMTVTFAMPSIVDALQAQTGPDNAYAYVIAAGVVGFASLPVFWLCFAATREPSAMVDANPKGFHLGAIAEDIRTVGVILSRNGPLLRVFACMIVSSLAFTMTNKCLTYYIIHDLQRPDLRQYILPFTLFVQFLFCPVWAAVAQRTSKRAAWLSANLVSVVAYAAFYFNESRDPVIAAALLGFIACANAAYLTLIWAMLPDTVEYTEWTTGQRHDAKVFGVASWAKQVALGVNGFALGALLTAVGYVEGGARQSAEAVAGVKAIMTIAPLIGLALSAWIMWGYRLDQATHARIRADIAARGVQR
ncbi:MAG: glycoside-pentoside-hexuronide (GPH):cation symporter [Hyphomonadaceae bacterium]|nr:glycoside-pentoside-hexuronide (GPH):cation symporter [Hyphomonadaceae bacterium]